MISKLAFSIAAFLVCSTSFAGGKSCAELFTMLVPKPKAEATVQVVDGQKFSVRSATTSDVSEVTRLIHNAFEVWKKQGLKLSPMDQTDAQTTSHLVGKGFVAEDSSGEIVGTFSLDNGSVSKGSNGSVQFVEGSDPSLSFSPVGNPQTLPTGRLLVFKKAAVRSDLAGSGLGGQLYQMAESLGRDNGYSGMVLETVKEAQWLYDWYVRLGFQPVGSYRYPGSQVETILMIKPFLGAAK